MTRVDLSFLNPVGRMSEPQNQTNVPDQTTVAAKQINQKGERFMGMALERRKRVLTRSLLVVNQSAICHEVYSRRQF